VTRLRVGLLERLVRHWPRKLGALALAVAVWSFVTSDTTTIAQRSLLVPIVVEGVGDEEVVVGLPQFAEVTVSGPVTRVDRLRAEGFEAVLDLTGVAGDFQARISVAPPQGIVLERVAPSEVIGIVESVVHARVPVVATVLGALGDDLRARPSVSPAQASVRGRPAVVTLAVAVVVPLPAADALAATSKTAAGYAVDAQGRPLPEVTVEPASFSLGWDLERAWLERRLPLEVGPLPPGPWSTPEGAPAEVIVVGLASVVAGLTTVSADVDLPTGPLESGRYTRPLRLRLPDGVVALAAPTVALSYTAPAPAPE